MGKKKTKKIVFKGVKDLPPLAVSLSTTKVNKTGGWRSMRSVIDEAKCVGCGICWKFCPEPCIIPGEKPHIDFTYCKGCGICAEECPTDAIRFEEEIR